jgi:ABC-type multidrug transport system fused ATPase/permease subunit
MPDSFRKYSSLLLHYLRPQVRSVFFLAIALFLNIGLQLVGPLVLRNFVDTVGSTLPVRRMIQLGLLYAGVSFLQQSISLVSIYLSENVGWRATNALRGDLVEHCLGLEMAFHANHTPGEMIERVDGDVNALSNFFSQFTIQIFGNMLLLVGILVVLFTVDWRVGSSITAVIVLTIVILGRLRNLAVPHWTKERQASAELFGFLEERLNSTEDIRANGAEAYILKRFFQFSRELMKRTLKAGMLVNVIVNTSWIMFSISTVVGMVVAAYLNLEGLISIGTVAMVVYMAGMTSAPLDRLIRQLQDIQRAGASINRVTDLLSISPKIDERTTLQDPSCLLSANALEVRFDQVNFSYKQAGPPVLEGLSFHLPAGKVLGLLGRTGSGKTTLARLLFRLYDPDSGAIQLAGHDLRALTTSELRQKVGLVSQNIQLFHASLRDNLTFFDTSIYDELIRDVLADLGLRSWLESLPDGLDTILEAGGGGLSAGEAQLLAFARLFLKHPGLVILDEATSRLDPATEALLERAVDRLVQVATAIIIAHRLGTVERADLILILEDGCVVEFGPRAELAADPDSHFFSLLQTGIEEVLV